MPSCRHSEPVEHGELAAIDACFSMLRRAAGAPAIRKTVIEHAIKPIEDHVGANDQPGFNGSLKGDISILTRQRWIVFEEDFAGCGLPDGHLQGCRRSRLSQQSVARRSLDTALSASLPSAVSRQRLLSHPEVPTQIRSNLSDNPAESQPEQGIERIRPVRQNV